MKEDKKKAGNFSDRRILGSPREFRDDQKSSIVRRGFSKTAILGSKNKGKLESTKTQVKMI
jgi:hypothetical protein